MDVFAIVSTNGDVGTMDASFVEQHGSIKAVRLAELDCAVRKLGFRKLFLFGYRDSGMMGSETSEHPDCSWQAPQEEMTRRVVEVIREARPQIILTHNRYGGYGHPDHIAIQRATTVAFDLAGDASFVTEGLAPWQPQKLYYSSSPTLMLRYGIMMMRLRGMDPRAVGRNKDIDMVAVLENIEPPHARVNVREWLDIWGRGQQLSRQPARRPTLAPAPLDASSLSVTRALHAHPATADTQPHRRTRSLRQHKGWRLFPVTQGHMPLRQYRLTVRALRPGDKAAQPLVLRFPGAGNEERGAQRPAAVCEALCPRHDTLDAQGLDRVVQPTGREVADGAGQARHAGPHGRAGINHKGSGRSAALAHYQALEGRARAGASFATDDVQRLARSQPGAPRPRP